MADPARPPSSEEGEISDGDEDFGPRSPDYKPKSPAYKPAMKEREEKKHHHHHHHKHHSREIEQTEENITITISSTSTIQPGLGEREAQLRNKLLAKTKERTSSSSETKDEKKGKEKAERARIKAPSNDEDGDDVEHFQVQPKDAKTEKSKTASDRDKGSKRERIVWRDRTPERIRSSGGGKHSDSTRDRPRYDVNKGGRDRHSDRRADDKDRGGERSGRKEESIIEKHRKREKEKEREKEKKEKDKDRKRTKKSRSKSPDEVEVKKVKEEISKMSTDETKTVESASRSPSQEKKIDSPVQDPHVGAILATIRRPGYSKWQENDEEELSEPEDDQSNLHNKSPADSTPILGNSDEDMESVEEDEDEEEEEFDPNTVPFEELTDEQKAKISPDVLKRLEKQWQQSLIDALPVYYAGILGCRSVNEFDCMNKVEEGTFGVVYRAKCKRTEEVVALKRLKMEKEKDGFPITSTREINMLLKAGTHENIVNVREIVVGHNIDKIFLVMEFVEHDLKSLMDTMKKRNKSFEVGHVKTLLQQLLSGLNHMHTLWILHRDLKTSNLLLTHNGVLKIADFGLAREYGDPLEKYTEVVVTLWYRAPELLLGTKLYSTPIDVWSVGCIMAEFIRLKPLWPGSGELDQIRKIFMDLGTPIIDKWPEVVELPLWKQLNIEHFQFNQLRKKFDSEMLDETAWKLLNSMLTYNPEKRMTCEEALKCSWFKEKPLPIPSAEFPTFPAKSEGGKAPPRREPEAPRQGTAMAELDEQTRSLYASLKIPEKYAAQTSGGFALKFDKDRF